MGILLGDGYLGIELLLGVVTFSYLFYYVWTLNYDYWKKRGVPFLEPSFPFGNTYSVITRKKFLGDAFKDMYFELKGHKFGGIINIRQPQLIVRDPEIIKLVLTKDFNYFVDRGLIDDTNDEPILEHLFNMRGDAWKTLRMKLTPTFTSGKMKMMFNIMKGCAERFDESTEKLAEKGTILEMKDYASRFGMDVIGSCAFGLEIGAIDSPDNEIRKNVNTIFGQFQTIAIKNFIRQSFPRLVKLLGIRMFPKEGADFFYDFVGRNVEYREKNNVQRNDFLNLLIQIKNKGELEKAHADHEDDDDDVDHKIRTMHTGDAADNEKGHTGEKSEKEFQLTTGSMAAQCLIFFIAGYETSSSTLSFCLHELAVNKVLQRKLQNEIDTVLHKHKGEISYESLKDMTYMDKCISETLRKYPPATNLLRECVKEYVIPGTDVRIEKKMKVLIPLLGIHYDPEYYPDPNKFDPERFTEEAKQSRPHYTWMPFGEGPRICIGMRFGLMQVKIGLTTLLSKYEFDIPPNTELPLKFDNKFIIASAKGGIKLKITKRNKNK